MLSGSPVLRHLDKIYISTLSHLVVAEVVFLVVLVVVLAVVVLVMAVFLVVMKNDLQSLLAR